VRADTELEDQSASWKESRTGGVSKTIEAGEGHTISGPDRNVGDTRGFNEKSPHQLWELFLSISWVG
jgi:hypothetical protein